MASDHPVYGRIDGPVVMIGFGSIGKGTWPLIERHFELMLDFYGPERGLLNFRKHAVKYIRGTEGASSIRSRAVQATTVQAFVDLVSEFGESAMIAA